LRQEEGKRNDKKNPNNWGLEALSDSAYLFDVIKYWRLTTEQKPSMRDYLGSGLFNPQCALHTLIHTSAFEGALPHIVVTSLKSDINVSAISFEKMIVYNLNIMKS
jgi:hypothetical protein